MLIRDDFAVDAAGSMSVSSTRSGETLRAWPRECTGPEMNGGSPILQKKVIQLYDELQGYLRRYIGFLGLNPEQAEDVIQETFLELFCKLTNGMRDDNLRGWIFRVAHNMAMNLHKSASRIYFGSSEEVSRLLEERIDPALNPEERVIKKERLMRVVAAVSCLTEQQQQCLHLRSEGLRYREISAMLGVSTQRVAEIIQSALVRLAGEL
jgi:RNA polymerase sigma-70 factor (ECF subfamily)